jgi:hypothetical protein
MFTSNKYFLFPVLKIAQTGDVKQVIRYRILEAGSWMLDAGYWILDAGCWIRISKYETVNQQKALQ